MLYHGNRPGQGCNMQVHVYHINNVSVVGHMINAVKNNNKISTNNLQTIQITVQLQRQYICTQC